MEQNWKEIEKQKWEEYNKLCKLRDFHLSECIKQLEVCAIEFQTIAEHFEAFNANRI
ncbi:MAG: hypothetical protein WC479_05985 [Candidatus Izemoplasmatales bacterium]